MQNRSTLRLPPKPPPTLGDFTKLCTPLVSKRVVVTHKLGALFFGRLDSLSTNAIRLQHVTMRTKDAKIKGIELLIIRDDAIAHIHEELSGVTDSGVMEVE